MNKRCPNTSCPSPLNDPSAMVCAACQSDLTYADEVFDDVGAGSKDDALVDPADPAGSGNTGGGSTEPVTPKIQGMDGDHPARECVCRFYQIDPDTGTCVACGGRRTADTGGIPGHGTGGTEQGFRLVFPDGAVTQMTDGLMLGREPIHANGRSYAVGANFPGVSRQHAWVGAIGGAVLILDAGSHNGTWVGEKRLVPFVACRLDSTQLPAVMWLGGKFRIVLERGG